MKIRVMMKDPDTLDDAIDEAIEADVASIADEEEREAVAEVRKERAHAVAKKWFEYGEYLQVEIDTEAKTCTVLAVGQ